MKRFTSTRRTRRERKIPSGRTCLFTMACCMSSSFRVRGRTRTDVPDTRNNEPFTVEKSSTERPRDSAPMDASRMREARVRPSDRPTTCGVRERVLQDLDARDMSCLRRNFFPRNFPDAFFVRDERALGGNRLDRFHPREARLKFSIARANAPRVVRGLESRCARRILHDATSERTHDGRVDVAAHGEPRRLVLERDADPPEGFAIIDPERNVSQPELEKRRRFISPVARNGSGTDASISPAISSVAISVPWRTVFIDRDRCDRRALEARA